MISVENKVPLLEINDKGTPLTNAPHIEVVSHWNSNSLVILKFDSQSLTVKATDLIAAINNAINTAKF
jgi:hypothetical protein